jgi:hypothetical protein
VFYGTGGASWRKGSLRGSSSLRLKNIAHDTITDDILYGSKAIAKFLGCDQRKIFYYKRTKLLPLGNIGREIIASKKALRQHVASQIVPAE